MGVLCGVSRLEAPWGPREAGAGMLSSSCHWHGDRTGQQLPQPSMQGCTAHIQGRGGGTRPCPGGGGGNLAGPALGTRSGWWGASLRVQLHNDGQLVRPSQVWINNYGTSSGRDSIHTRAHPNQPRNGRLGPGTSGPRARGCGAPRLAHCRGSGGLCCADAAPAAAVLRLAHPAVSAPVCRGELVITPSPSTSRSLKQVRMGPTSPPSSSPGLGTVWTGRASLGDVLVQEAQAASWY